MSLINIGQPSQIAPYPKVSSGVQLHPTWYPSGMLFTKRLRDARQSTKFFMCVTVPSPALAKASGFLGVLDLLKVAQHGRGQNIYLIRFHYIPPGRTKKKS